jgi:hypothetical protein
VNLTNEPFEIFRFVLEDEPAFLNLQACKAFAGLNLFAQSISLGLSRKSDRSMTDHVSVSSIQNAFACGAGCVRRSQSSALVASI